MTAAVINMDELVSAMRGNVHVSQDGYDLKALQVSVRIFPPAFEALHMLCLPLLGLVLTEQDYLARTITIPQVQSSPATHLQPLPPSRSVSSTRKHNSLPTPQFPPGTAVSTPYDFGPQSSAAKGYFHSAEDVSMAAQAQRPAALRRSSSFAGETLEIETEFQDDAFAPLFARSAPADPWRGFTQKSSAWGAFSGASPAFSQIQPAQPVQHTTQHDAWKEQEPILTVMPVEEDQDMDQDMAENIDMEEEDSVDAGLSDNGELESNHTWRGRW